MCRAGFNDLLESCVLGAPNAEGSLLPTWVSIMLSGSLALFLTWHGSFCVVLRLRIPGLGLSGEPRDKFWERSCWL